MRSNNVMFRYLIKSGNSPKTTCKGNNNFGVFLHLTLKNQFLEIENIQLFIYLLIFRALNSHDLLEQDRLILERLALKRFKEAENQVKSHIFKKQWIEERSRWQKCQKTHELLWQNEIRSKRKMEADLNEAKLIEARKKLIQSQEQLKWFIQQKQLRADEQVKEAQRQGLTKVQNKQKQK